MLPEDIDSHAEIERLTRTLERERATRLEAESISQMGLRDLRERQTQLELLARIAPASNQMGSLRDVLQFAVVQICQFTHWEVGHSFLTVGSGQAQHLQSTGMWHAENPGRIKEFCRTSEAMVFGPGIGLPGRALSHGKPLWILDIADETNFPRLPVAHQCGLKSAAAFPVFSGNEVVAVLEFFGGDAREPSDTLLDLMSQIGQQLGRVIERQRADDALRGWTKELMQARDEAKAADIAKSAFLANMSHELRTPLNAIIGFSEMIQTEMLGPVGNTRYLDYAKHVHDSGTHLLGLINDVLDLSKLDAGFFELRDETVALEPLFASCVQFVLPLATKAQVRICFRVEPSFTHVRGDEKRLRQILLNLLSNAVKFTPEGGTVNIIARCDGETPTLCVSDTGIGIAAQDIPRALERFGQVDNKLSRKYEGTGLGLPLAKKLAELHGGRLEIESEVGSGTRVSIILPAERLVSASRAHKQQN